ncbi:MAG: RNA polymerase sigma factor [Clostridia bacterium]|nr:RNA polymerase sigma factor [Clostridia bacterium]
MDGKISGNRVTNPVYRCLTGDGEKVKTEIVRKAGGVVRKEKKEISTEALCAEYEAVYRYLLVLCRNREEAEDITQEVFLRAMKSASKFAGDSSLYTWLCAIGKNLWLNRCKKRGREVQDEMLSDRAGDESVEDALAEKDTALRIHRILHGLPEPYKEVFSLRVFGQLAYGEIAALFGKTESWARVTYHRAKKMILEESRKEGIYESDE